MDFPKKCVFSGSTENLNTCMTVTLPDGQRVAVWISDGYADTATPSKIKEAATKMASDMVSEKETRQREVDALMKQAAALGLVLAPSIPNLAEQITTGATVLSHPEHLTQATQPTRQLDISNSDIKPSNPNNRMVDGKMADRMVSTQISGSVSALGSTVSGGGSEYKIHSGDKPSTDLKEGEVAEIGLVKGRGGFDIAIPVRRVGKTGETRVNIIETGGDTELQRRFKQLKMQSEDPRQGPHDFIRGGYQVRTVNCSCCNGTGKVMGKRECPKCGGAGIRDVQR